MLSLGSSKLSRVLKMSEKINEEHEKGEEHAKTIFQKLSKVSGKFCEEAEKEYKVIIYDVRKLVKQVDKRLDKAKNITREAFTKLRERTRKAIKKMVDSLPQAEEENDLWLYE